MSQQVSLSELWNSVPFTNQRFQPHQVAHLPKPVQRYLQHAIAQQPTTFDHTRPSNSIDPSETRADVTLANPSL